MFVDVVDGGEEGISAFCLCLVVGWSSVSESLAGLFLFSFIGTARGACADVKISELISTCGVDAIVSCLFFLFLIGGIVIDKDWWGGGGGLLWLIRLLPRLQG